MHGDARGWRLSLSEIVRIVLKETVALIWKLFQIYADFFFLFCMCIRNIRCATLGRKVWGKVIQ